jgi:hypothetical protein
MFGVRWRSSQVITVVLTLLIGVAVVATAGFQLAGQPSDSAQTNPRASTATGRTGQTPSSGDKTNGRAQLPSGQAVQPGATTPQPRLIADGAQLTTGAPLGGIHQDQGSSIPLPDGHTLWIFADTFQLYNKPKFFITSSAGVTNPNSWQLSYSKTSKGIPTEFLPRTPAELADHLDGNYYEAVWPTGATQLPDGRILIAYAKYRVLLKTQNFTFLGAGLFEYRYNGLDGLLSGGHATRIASDLWGVNDGQVRSPVYADGYVYFSQCEQDLRCYPMRSTPARVSDRSSYRWWTGSGWSTHASQRQAIEVAGDKQPGGNSAVVRLASGGYAMADTEIGAVSTTGLLWVAPHPWGPWSRPVSYTFPRCPAPGCYGLNIHPSQSTNREVRISYATNGVGPFVRLYDVPVTISDDSSSIQIRWQGR